MDRDRHPLIQRWTTETGRRDRERVIAEIRGGTIRPGKDLRGIDLRGLALQQCDLSHARLALADLRGCNLTGARFDCAELEAALLSQSNLGDVCARGCRARGAYFEGADARRADLRFSNLHGTSWTFARLTAAHLEGATLGRANMRNACLIGASLAYCDLEGAALAGARYDQRSRKPTVIEEVAISGGWPSFAESFRPGSIMGALHGRSEALLDVRAWLRTSRDPSGEVRRMLVNRDHLGWQPDLMAAVAICASAVVGPPIEKILWKRLNESWASPQLAVAAFLKTTSFESRARELLSSDGATQKTRASLQALLDGRSEQVDGQRALTWLRAIRDAFGDNESLAIP